MCNARSLWSRAFAPGDVAWLMVPVSEEDQQLEIRRTCTRLKQEGPSKNSLRALLLMTAVLLIVATLAFWITLQ